MKKLIISGLLFTTMFSYANAEVVNIDEYVGDLSSIGTNVLPDDFMDGVMGGIDGMMEDFGTWEENFNFLMKDFQANLDKSLKEMESRIEYMVKGMMNDLNSQIKQLDEDLKELTDELPNKIINSLDDKLEVFFKKLDVKSLTDVKYVENLNKLTDKIEEISDSGRFTTDAAMNTLEYIGLKTDSEKAKIVSENVNSIGGSQTNKLTEAELKETKELFDMLEIH